MSAVSKARRFGAICGLVVGVAGIMLVGWLIAAAPFILGVVVAGLMLHWLGVF